MSLSSEIIPAAISFFCFRLCFHAESEALKHSVTVYVFSLCFHAGTEAS